MTDAGRGGAGATRAEQAGERVMFLDDDEEILASYRRVYAKRFDLVTLMDARAALEALDADGPFAVIVADLLMPGMDGLEFFNLVREKSPDTIRVLLTAFSEPSRGDQALQDGLAWRVLTKPCLPDELARVVDLALERRRQSG